MLNDRLLFLSKKKKKIISHPPEQKEIERNIRKKKERKYRFKMIQDNF